MNPKIPDWWRPSLYDFTADMSIEGWVWEFLRRQKLKDEFGKHPVEAMNLAHKIPGAQEPPDIFYFAWNEDMEESVIVDFSPSSVRISDPNLRAIRISNSSIKAHCSYVHSDQIFEKEVIKSQNNTVGLKIDMDRSNSRLVSDFIATLMELRNLTKKGKKDKKGEQSKLYPAPERVRQRMTDWAASYVLEIWDLKELGLTWDELEEQFENINRTTLRHSFSIAKRYIDDKNWITLTDKLKLPKRTLYSMENFFK